MADRAVQSVLERKAAGNGGVRKDGFPSGEIARWIGWAAENAAGLSLCVSDIQFRRESLSAQLSPIGDLDMRIGLFQDGDLAGVAALSPDLRCAIVEQATLGRLSRAPTLDRAPTRADVALAEPFLSVCLDGLAPLVRDHVPAGWGQNLTLGRSFATNRQLELALTDSPYLAIEVKIDLSNSDRAGHLIIVVAEHLAKSEPKDEPAPLLWSKEWPKTVGAAPLKLNAVLGRLTLPLSALTGAQIGEILPLPGVNVCSVQLEAASGRGVTRARLGQMSGFRAIRVEAAHPVAMSDLSGLSAPYPEASQSPALSLESAPMDLASADPDPLADPMPDMPEIDMIADMEPGLAEVDTADQMESDTQPDLESIGDVKDENTDGEGAADFDLDLPMDFDLPEIDLDLS